MNILFVCTGNTCRSPMAEALLKSRTDEYQVESAGIYAGEGERANKHTIAVLKEKNIPIVHKSQGITEQKLHWADLILTMTTSHKQSLILQHPNFQEKYFTLKEYVDDTDKEVWRDLKTAYAELEEKRSIFIQENSHKIDRVKLERELMNHLQADLIKIQNLENGLSNFDISDPFGGSMLIYQNTLAEIDQQIDLLVEKLKRQS